MNKRLMTAMGSYAILAILATATLDGTLRIFIWIFLAALMLKTYIAYRAGW